ncbi:auxin-responsive protein SAUR78-like [Syzygium oleosum]|uniref:auxin-responsive protein SAUR78-like n=1 Tax=Syzygium oleosum TaxID=219896 RepID=UPI0011D299A1|nr:auxin-responsive protein SAUR78-like [Syzygium oleosum]
MAKGGKLTKLKSVLKKWNSFGRASSNGAASGRRRSSSNISAVSDDGGAPASPTAVSPSDLHPVYVGKSRRRYLVGPAVLRHPLFRELVERSSPGDDCAPNDDETAAVSVACEVVLFEHLLWMLENADPQPGSMDELVEFYAC